MANVRYHTIRARSALLMAEVRDLDAQAAELDPDLSPERRVQVAKEALVDVALFRRSAERHSRLALGMPGHDDPPDFDDLLADRPSHATDI